MDLDVILNEIGQFGRYQTVNLLYLVFPIIFTAFFSLSYVFTAGDLEYRCRITECEIEKEAEFTPKWLRFAVPERVILGEEKCTRFKSNTSLYQTSCTRDLFTKEVERCHKFVFRVRESTIVSDFELFCDENQCKRTIIGTVNSIGQFVGMPLGWDIFRFGRKTMVITGGLVSTVLGLLRSLSPSYAVFLTFELLDAIVSSGIYSGCFILGVELVGPEKRILASVIMACFYSVGEIILGTAMWLLKDWRYLLRVLYLPGILFIFYIWFIPESLRWLFARGKYNKATNIINKIASINYKLLSPETKAKLEVLCRDEMDTSEKEGNLTSSMENMKHFQLKDILSSKTMVLRVINCSFCWCTNTLVFYGLALNSVTIAGNKYVNFILVSIVEIPGYVITWGLMHVIGRRTSLIITLVTSGTSCMLFYFVHNDFLTMKLILFLIGKMAITSSFTILYTLTTEMFPTNARHSLLGICSMFGRIGSIIAPLTPILAAYVDPTLCFGSVALTAGILALFFPETVNTKLPDSLEEAEDIGKKKSSNWHSNPNRVKL